MRKFCEKNFFRWKLNEKKNAQRSLSESPKDLRWKFVHVYTFTSYCCCCFYLYLITHLICFWLEFIEELTLTRWDGGTPTHLKTNIFKKFLVFHFTSRWPSHLSSFFCFLCCCCWCLMLLLLIFIYFAFCCVLFCNSINIWNVQYNNQ